MTVTLSTAAGYGRAHASTTEDFVLENLPAGYLFWAFQSTLMDDHDIYVYQNESMIVSQPGNGAITGKLPTLEGDTIRIHIGASSSSYYMLGWGHSALDNNPEHWDEQPPLWISVSAEDQIAVGRHSGAFQTYVAETPPEQYALVPINHAIEMNTFYRAANDSSDSSYMSGPGDNNYSGSVGFWLNSTSYYYDNLRQTFHSVMQSAHVFRLPDATTVTTPPEVEHGYDTKQPWGRISTGNTGLEYGTATFLFNQVNRTSSWIGNGGEVVTNGAVPMRAAFRAVEAGSFTGKVAEQGQYVHQEADHWSTQVVGWQTGIGFPLFELDNSGATEVAIPGSVEILTPELLSVLDLSVPGSPQRYLAISGSINPRHERPDTSLSPQIPDIGSQYYDGQMDAGVIIVQDAVLMVNVRVPASTVYKGFPLFGVLKVMTGEGWRVTGLTRKDYANNTDQGNGNYGEGTSFTVGLLKLDTGQGWVEEADSYFTGGSPETYVKPLYIKVEGGWEVAAEMQVPNP